MGHTAKSEKRNEKEHKRNGSTNTQVEITAGVVTSIEEVQIIAVMGGEEVMIEGALIIERKLSSR